MPIWSSRVSDLRWKFSADTAWWRPPKAMRFGCPSTLRRYGRWSAARRLSRCSAPWKRKRKTVWRGVLEEDARLTALFLWTLQATTADETPDVVAASDKDVPADDTDVDDESASDGKAKGFSLVFDVVRRFAQPLGIDLPKWEKRTIETKKGVVRLLPVTERAKQLFGEQGSQAVAAWLEQGGSTASNPLQGVLFPDREQGESFVVREPRSEYGDTSDRHDATTLGTTTLDRVHTGMLLQAGGRSNGLRALLKAEQERGPDFLRLSNALSALYPRGSDEKRLLDAMLLAVPR